MRNIGSSFFIALCVTEIVRTQAQNYERLGESISPYNATLHLPWVMGSWSIDTLADLSRLAKEINRQAAMIGYLNAFTLYTRDLGVGGAAGPAGAEDPPQDLTGRLTPAPTAWWDRRCARSRS